MNNVYKILVLLAVVALAVPQVGHAQGAYVRTTLSADLAVDATTMAVASNTGMTPAADATTLVPGGIGNNTLQVAAIDHELVQIQGVIGTTGARITRGYNGTVATSHVSGSLVFTGPPAYFYTSMKSGKCAGSTQTVNPAFVVNLAGDKDLNLVECNGAQFVPSYILPGDAVQPNAPKQYVQTVPIGSVAYASFGTSKANVDGTLWWISVVVPAPMVAKGISVLTGGTQGGAASYTTALYGGDGIGLLANSALTSQCAAGPINTFTNCDFTSPILLSSGTYILAVQTVGTTDSIRTVAASTFPGLITGNATGTSGTLPATITPGTSFVADKGPIAYIYPN